MPLGRFSWERDTAVRLLASQNCTLGIIKEALPRWPGPSYKTCPFVSGVCFDNFTVKVNYNTTHSVESQSYRLDMTNWATAAIPLATVHDVNVAALHTPRLGPGGRSLSARPSGILPKMQGLAH